MRRLIRRLLVDASAQDMIEYAMLATVVALACMAGVGALRTAVISVFTVISNQLAAIN